MHKQKGLLFVLGAGILWGSTLGLYARFMDALGFTPMQTTAVRMLVSAVVFLLYALLFDRRLFRIHWKDCCKQCVLQCLSFAEVLPHNFPLFIPCLQKQLLYILILTITTILIIVVFSRFVNAKPFVYPVLLVSPLDYTTPDSLSIDGQTTPLVV